MRNTHRARLQLEKLEDRWVPSTTRQVGSLLLVSDQHGALTLTQTSQNQFKVQDSSPSSITYSNISSVYVTGTNSSDTITVNLNSFTYTGSLLFNTGNGNDTVTITSPGTAAVNGNTTILSGLGNDIVNLNSQVAGSAAGIRFGGNVYIQATANGTKTLNFGNLTTATTVGGTFQVFGFNTVDLGVPLTPTPYVANVFGGYVTVQDGSLSIPVNFLAEDGDVFSSSVTINTGSGPDTVFFNAVTVAGNTYVNLGTDSSSAKPDAVQMGQYAAFVQTPAIFAGNVNVTQGSGTAFVRIATAVTIGGDFDVNMGNGNKNVEGDSDRPGFTVSGNENITVGNGNNNLALNANVAGNLNINLGNSTPGIGNFTFINSAPGGTLSYHSGNGPDTIDLYPEIAGQVWNIRALFGTNDDNFILDVDPANPVNATLIGYIDGGGRLAGNSFTETATNWTLTSDLTVTNFP